MAEVICEEDLKSMLEFVDFLISRVEIKEKSVIECVMAPPVDDELNFMQASSDATQMEDTFLLQEYILYKVDEFQTQLFNSQDCSQNNDIASMVSAFLIKCQPYFTYFESTARNTSPGTSPLSLYLRTQLLQFSQQLCNRLEQIALKWSSLGYFTLEETDPLGISHFHIGQCHIDNMKLSIFRYVLPCPYLAYTHNTLYKRMRWNVEWQTERCNEHKDETYRTEGAQKTEEQQEQKEILIEQERNSTEYYFLCCEDVHVAEDSVIEETTPEKMWSIGQWVQTYPDPSLQDIYNWVLCLVPQGEYKQLVYLGKKEPSICTATDCLLGMLLSQGDPAVNHTTT